MRYSRPDIPIYPLAQFATKNKFNLQHARMQLHCHDIKNGLEVFGGQGGGDSWTGVRGTGG